MLTDKASHTMHYVCTIRTVSRNITTADVLVQAPMTCKTVLTPVEQPQTCTANREIYALLSNPADYRVIIEWPPTMPMNIHVHSKKPIHINQASNNHLHRYITHLVLLKDNDSKKAN